MQEKYTICPFCKKKLDDIEDWLSYNLDCCINCKYYNYTENFGMNEYLILNKYILFIRTKEDNILMMIGENENSELNFYDEPMGNRRKIEYFDFRNYSLEQLNNKLDLYEIFE